MKKFLENNLKKSIFLLHNAKAGILALFVVFFTLSSCNKNGDLNTGGTGNLNVSVKGITTTGNDPQSRAAGAAAKTLSGSSAANNDNPQICDIPFKDSYVLRGTLQKTVSSGPKTYADSAELITPGTYYRVAAYKGKLPSDAVNPNYKDTKVFQAGHEGDVQWLLPAGDYYFIAYSYNSTTDNVSTDHYYGPAQSIISGPSPNDGRIAPPTDVLYWGGYKHVVDGNNNLNLIFSHVFTRIRVNLDASYVNTSGPITVSGGGIVPSYYANIQLSTGVASIATTNPAGPAKTLTWTVNGSKAISNDLLVYTGGKDSMFVTFPANSIHVTLNSGPASNSAPLTFRFDTKLLSGSDYTLNITLAKPLNVVSLGGFDPAYVYNPAEANRGGAGMVVNSIKNFGPDGIAKTGYFFNWIRSKAMSGNVDELNSSDAPYQWLTGNGHPLADVLVITYWFAVTHGLGASSTTCQPYADLVYNYLKKGGVAILLMDSNPLDGMYFSQDLFQDIYASSSPSRTITASMPGGGGSVYQLPSIPGDSVLNGPFGNASGQFWGNDANAATCLSGLPMDGSDPNLTIYSNGTDVSYSTPTPYPSLVTGLKYQTPDTSTSPINLIWFGDGGFLGSRLYPLGPVYAGYPAIFPFYWDVTTRRPLERPSFGGGGTTHTIYNSILFCNAMAWAIQRADALKNFRNAH